MKIEVLYQISEEITQMNMTRSLTEKEIEDILEFILPNEHIPHDTALSIVERSKESFRRQLVKQMVHPEIIPELKREMFRQYRRSMIPNGESVGIICAQSVGEKQTQALLNAFHHSGISEKTTTTGVPRFQELINATKKPKIVNNTIFFKNAPKTIQEARQTAGSDIVGLCLKNIAKKITINMNKVEEPWYAAYQILYSNEFTEHDHCITFELDGQKMFEYKLTMQQITNHIHNEYDDLFCVFSPPNIGRLDIFVDTSNIVLPEDRLLFVDQENAPLIYLEECVQPTLEELYVCGIPAITEIFYGKRDGEWLAETNGFSSKKVLKQHNSFLQLLSLPQVDYTRTISNNVWDIYEVLDIEAARQFLIEEFTEIMDGINACHTLLLVDRMTYGGTIASISRYTLKADEGGAFSKASFEESLDHLLSAAAQGQHEPTKGVSASIICGKRANIGTNAIQVAIDMDRLPQGLLDEVPDEDVYSEGEIPMFEE